MDKNKIYELLKKDIKNKDWESLSKEDLINEIKKVIKTIYDINNNKVNKYISDRVLYFESKDYFPYVNQKEFYNNKIKDIEEKISKKSTKEETQTLYNRILHIYSEVNKIHKDFLDKEDPNKEVSEERKEYQKYFNSLDHDEKIKELSNLANEITGSINSATKELNNIADKAEEINERLESIEDDKTYCVNCKTEVTQDDIYCPECGMRFVDTITEEEQSPYSNNIVYNELDPWQKKEVDEGNYDPFNFEEEELEEDDYYSEDE